MTEQPTAAQCNEALQLVTKLVAAREGPTEAKAWRQLNVYCPDWVVMARDFWIRPRDASSGPSGAGRDAARVRAARPEISIVRARDQDFGKCLM